MSHFRLNPFFYMSKSLVERTENVYKRRLTDAEDRLISLEVKLDLVKEVLLDLLHKLDSTEINAARPSSEEKPSSEGNKENKSVMKGALNILLAEDNPLLQRMFVKHFGKDNVFTASTGPEALELFKQRSFNIVFLDIQLPQLDGFAVAREIRSREKVVHTPIIGISGNRDNEALALQAGMDEFIYKGEGYSMDILDTIIAKSVH